MNTSVEKPQSTVERPQRMASQTYGLSYACAMPVLTETANKHGYALAVHGSMATDLDLIATPWVDEASDADTLAEAIRDCLGGMFANGRDEFPSAVDAAGIKPHGRRAYTILPSNLFLGVPRLPWRPFIDLSVTPRINTQSADRKTANQQ